MQENIPGLQRLCVICSNPWRRVLYCCLSMSVFVFCNIATSTPVKSENFVKMQPCYTTYPPPGEVCVGDEVVAREGQTIRVTYSLTEMNPVNKVLLVWSRPREIFEPLPQGVVVDEEPSY